MKKPELKIETNLQVEELVVSKDAKSPNSTLSPSERDFFKSSLSDPQIVLDFRSEETPVAMPKERDPKQISPPEIASSLSLSQDITVPASFLDARQNFIKKVLSLLFLQLAVTVGVITLTFFPSLGVAEFMRNTPGVIIGSGVVCLACLIILTCKRDFCRKVPRNYILMLVFTLSISYILGGVSACTTGDVVLFAGASTLVIVIAISAYACKAKTNLTNTGMGTVTLLCAIVLGLVIGIVWPEHILTALYSAIAACIFGLHLAYDIQKLAGKYENHYSLDDYIIASMDIYIDIIQIFVALINLIRRLV